MAMSHKLREQTEDCLERREKVEYFISRAINDGFYEGSKEVFLDSLTKADKALDDLRSFATRVDEWSSSDE